MIAVNTLCDSAGMDSPGSRLRYAREQAGFDSAMSAAERFGWTKSTYAAHENGQNNFKGDTALRYAKSFKTTASWLLLGEGEPPSKTDQTKRPSLVRSFDPADHERDPDAGTQREEASPFPPDAIRELVAKGGMGAGQVITTSYVRDGVEITATDAVRDDYWKFPADFVRSTLRTQVPSLLAIECQGDSMEPTIQAGERVWVDTAHKKPSPDGIYAIRDTLEEIVVKRLELTDDKPPRVAVISDNKNHGRKVYGLDEIVVVGRVVCSLRLF